MTHISFTDSRIKLYDFTQQIALGWLGLIGSGFIGAFDMTTTFFPVAINFHVAPATKIKAIMRAKELYDAVWFGRIEDNPSSDAVLDCIKSLVKERKEKGYDPNPIDNPYKFNSFVPKGQSKEFNSVGWSVSGNGSTISIERWVKEGNTIDYYGAWLKFNQDGSIVADKTDHTWFPSALCPMRGGFRGFDLDYDFYLSEKDGRIYTTREDQVDLNPTSHRAEHIMDLVQVLYAPSFATGESLFGVKPTESSYGKEEPRPDLILAHYGDLDVIVPSRRSVIYFGKKGMERHSFFHSFERTQEQTMSDEDSLWEYLHKREEDLRGLYDILESNGENDLVWGLQNLYEYLNSLYGDSEAEKFGLGNMDLNTLRQRCGNYSVLFAHFREYCIMKPQICREILLPTAQLEFIDAVDEINTSYRNERRKKSGILIPLERYVDENTPLKRDVLSPLENFKFSFNGKDHTLDEVCIPNEGITLANLKRGEFYFGGKTHTTSPWSNINTRYAKDFESGALDDIVNLVFYQNMTRDSYRKPRKK